MPRRRSGGRSARARPARRAAPSRPAPQPVNRAPPPVAAQSNRGGIGSMIAAGMAFGTGITVARRAVDALLGPRTIQHETVATGPAAATPASTANSVGSNAFNVHLKAFIDCLNSYRNDISKCQFYMDMLAKCRRNSGAILSA